MIDAGVEIGRDTVIAPFTSLHGATRIGDGCHGRPLSTLIDASIGARRRSFTPTSKGAVVGDRVSVGPFAYLRPGAVLREGAKAGTFVEIKNSDVGAGSKVPHLSYIGDTDIGERTNIGAGNDHRQLRRHEQAPHDDRRGRVRRASTRCSSRPSALGDGAYTGPAR